MHVTLSRRLHWRGCFLRKELRETRRYFRSLAVAWPPSAVAAWRIVSGLACGEATPSKRVPTS
jgi:hypothetical protein